MAMFQSLRKKLARTKSRFVGRLAETIRLRGKVDEELMENLEETLIEGDIGIDLAMDIVERLREEVRLHKITEADEVQQALTDILFGFFLSEGDAEPEPLRPTSKPWVALFVGVNGVGKTTTIGKLARRLRDEGKSVSLVAADTFRAAAIEQLGIWAERADAHIVRQQQGADPSSVVFDGLKHALHNDIDVVLIDTAGRQHTKVNLMNELAKVNRTIRKLVPDGPHECILVIDATTGQNAIQQTRLFNAAAPLTGLALTKLDGTAKGGIVLGIRHTLDVPVRLIGVGEAVEDLRDFEPRAFAEALFGVEAGDEA
ncbi:MAG: signal recognition particle-docking protein FtsY [Candidatus Cloacimonetes bacterium]|nr:signal recognition particle-docking protein FtsY [Candidatus Cloacimonadota bacterium]